MSESVTRPTQTADIRDYLRIARFDHATKHVFIIPGIILAFLLRPEQASLAPWPIIAGFVSAVAIASANYVINEWLDRDFDRYHPEKSQRAAVQREMSPTIVLIEYAAFLSIGLGLAASVNPVFLAVSVLFAISGIAYNVKPLRTKDVVFVDVLTESLNNPLRLMLGWAMVEPTSMPPASMLLAFWFGGAFLMNAKRLAEFRDICAEQGQALLARYRRSFKHYTERRLLVATLLYALLCAFFTAIFFVKYKIEYIIVFPAITLLFCEYFILALTPNSVARKPENLFKARRLVLLSAGTAALFMLATVIQIPALEQLTDAKFIEFGQRSHDP